MGEFKGTPATGDLSGNLNAPVKLNEVPYEI